MCLIILCVRRTRSSKIFHREKAHEKMCFFSFYDSSLWQYQVLKYPRNCSLIWKCQPCEERCQLAWNAAKQGLLPDETIVYQEEVGYIAIYILNEETSNLTTCAYLEICKGTELVVSAIKSRGNTSSPTSDIVGAI